MPRGTTSKGGTGGARGPGAVPFTSPTTTGAPGELATAAAALAEAASLVTPELLKLSSDMVTVVARGTWQDLGSEEEIRRENASAAQRRPRIHVTHVAPRNVLLHQNTRGSRGGSHVAAGPSSHGATMDCGKGTLFNYITKEASEDCRDLRATANALYSVRRGEVETGVQATPQRLSERTQTHFARKVNAAVQAEPTLVDASIHHMTDLPKKESPDLSAFLGRVLPRTLHCLTQSVEVPIYTDDFTLLREDDAIVGTRDDMVLVEKGNFVHAATKDRRVTSLGWRSGRGRDDAVCIASIAPYSLEDRIDAQRRCESSVSLVWDLSDPMHPRYILESPNEVQVLKFSPAHPHLVAGGAMNGQVYLWDLSQADRLSVSGGKGKGAGFTSDGVDFREAGELPPMPESVNGVSWEKDGDLLVPRLHPVQVSRVELSHHRPVHDLQWLPANLECGFDGRQAVTTDEGSHQFATVSDDGSMCVWDTRPDHLPADKLRKMKHQTKSSGAEVVWVPLLRYQLTKPDLTGAGDVMGFRFFFDGTTADEQTPSYTVAIGGTDGEFATCSAIALDTASSAVVPVFGQNRDTRFVRHVVDAHAGSVNCVQRHPTIGDVYLTCGDHTFKVWRAGVDTALYRSPFLESAVTCAAWSPSRAAVVLIGTEGGKIQVWDLLDRNNEPLLVHHMVQDAVTVLTFKPAPARQSSSTKFSQHVIIGTTLGTFHWYVLPPALSRGSSGERRNFRAMLEREARRVTYYGWRWTERRLEMERLGASAPKMVISRAATQQQQQHPNGDAASPPGAAKKGGKKGTAAAAAFSGADDDSDSNGGDDDPEHGYGYDAQRDSDFLALVEELRVKNEESTKVEAIK